MDVDEIKGDVLHIVSPEKARNYKWYDESNKLPSGLQILSIDDINNLPEKARSEKFINERYIPEGSVWIYDPYTKKYVSAAAAEQSLLDSKFDTLTTIASLLGASKISISVETVEESMRKLDSNGDVSYKVVKVSAKIKKQTSDKYKNRYEKTREYSNPTLTREGYEQARRLCEISGLTNTFKFLLLQRHPDHPNPLKREEYTVELSKELNESLDTAFHLNIMKGVFSLNASINEAISSTKRVIIKTVIEF